MSHMSSHVVAHTFHMSMPRVFLAIFQFFTVGNFGQFLTETRGFEKGMADKKKVTPEAKWETCALRARYFFGT